MLERVAQRSCEWPIPGYAQGQVGWSWISSSLVGSSLAALILSILPYLFFHFIAILSWLLLFAVKKRKNRRSKMRFEYLENKS